VVDTPQPGPAAVPSDRGVYSISVAAELVGTGVQNLRLYEARGLVSPDRTDGGTRRYSEDDVARLQRVTGLLDQGLNLAGVVLVLGLEDDVARLRHENALLSRRAPSRRFSPG
jgi:DNA-binding transcriptional MerR regulator